MTQLTRFSIENFIVHARLELKERRIDWYHLDATCRRQSFGARVERNRAEFGAALGAQIVANFGQRKSQC